MIVEVHILQNVAPSLLNRDDTGMHKRQSLGGYTRLSLSPQSQKKAMRDGFRVEVGDDHRGVRSLLIPARVRDALVTRGWTEQDAETAVKGAFGAVGVTLKEGLKTDVLLFAPARAIEEIAAICERFRDDLLGAGRKEREIKAEVAGALNAKRSIDVALFGRMIANEKSALEPFDAAVQMAHALGTSKASQASEFDYFTAVDDLRTVDAGAGHIGSREYGSTVFYRYAAVDGKQLATNLDGDQELATRGIEAFARGMIETLPSGTQNNAAAHNPPSLIVITVRDRGAMSLANAFVDPVSPTRERDLVAGSIHALDDYLGRMDAMYDTRGLVTRAACVDPGYSKELVNLAAATVPNVAALYQVARSGIPSGVAV